MKLTLLRFKKYLLYLAIPYILIIALGTFRIDYEIKVPGFTDSVESFIEIDNAYPSSGSFHTTSIIDIEKPTILMYMLSYFDSRATVTELPEIFQYISVNDSTVMGYLTKDDSINTALALSLDRLDLESEIVRYKMVYLTMSYLTVDTLEAGDYILSINGNTDIDLAFSETICEEYSTFEIQRDEEVLVYEVYKNLLEDDHCAFGMYAQDYTDIVSTEIEYTIIPNDTGGPSGGLMQSLYVYNQLTETDYTHGLKIGGTGTINTYGEVGYIGAVKQKIITAASTGIDIFFIPHLSDEDNDNYIEALLTYNTLDTDMILVGVSSFDEALDFLITYEGGAQ